MDLLDVAGAAEYLGVSPQRIRQFCADKRIGEKLGSRWVFTLGELVAFKAIDRPPGRPLEKTEGEGDNA